LQEQKPINATSLEREDYLYRAMRRYLKNWHEAMRAAGLDPAAYRRGPSGTSSSTEGESRDSVARQSQADKTLRPNCPV